MADRKVPYRNRKEAIRAELERRRVRVCTENLILFDYVTESPNVNTMIALLLPPDPVRLAIQVEEPT
jgi:hypothetical protein